MFFVVFPIIRTEDLSIPRIFEQILLPFDFSNPSTLVGAFNENLKYLMVIGVKLIAREANEISL